MSRRLQEAANLSFDAAQALLAGFDASVSTNWRQEDREWRQTDLEFREEEKLWRKEDLGWREEERLHKEEERQFRLLSDQWRSQDIEQRNLENARYLWLRFADRTRRDLEEKGELLRSLSYQSALFAGFAVIAYVEFAIDVNNVSHVIIVGFAITTSTLSCLMVLVTLQATLMLVAVMRQGKSYLSEEAEAEYLESCRQFAYQTRAGPPHAGLYPPSPRRTFEEFWNARCEETFKFLFTAFSIGVPVFILNLVFIGWLKFHYSLTAAITATFICAVAGLVWIYNQLQWGSFILHSSTEPGGTSLSHIQNSIITTNGGSRSAGVGQSEVELAECSGEAEQRDRLRTRRTGNGVAPPAFEWHHHPRTNSLLVPQEL